MLFVVSYASATRIFPKTIAVFTFIVTVGPTLFSKTVKFEQLGEMLPTPTEVRLASGAPGPDYWQQEANYRIKVELDEKNHRIQGSETIDYINHSPHTLNYIWVQLDQNAVSQDSKRQRSTQAPDLEPDAGVPAELEYEGFREFLYSQQFEGGYALTAVTDANGEPLTYTVVGTNMRIDLDQPMSTGDAFTFNIDWEFTIVDESLDFRHGKRKLKNGEYAYHLAQWYPRVCAYYDQQGWQVKQYIKQGEFALEFGDFEVEITVPADYIVAATGELTNAPDVLSSTMQNRLIDARTSDRVVDVVTAEEAEEKVGNKPRDTRTWKFSAENVRDYAFAASRAYQWDAKGVEVDGKTVMAMSVYPVEAAPLWRRYSTEAVAHTLRVYSNIVYPYPYPLAWSAWGPEGGMEYPMISFQTTRDIDEVETYPGSHRNYVISVIIHEVGHNWFPMVINNDERQWMWMDEGLNSYVDYRAGNLMDNVLQEQNLLGDRRTIRTMAGADDPIIMVSADLQTSRGFQSYSKPALGLHLLRESIMGHELFDFAFKEYARRWAFKRPTPADFFRTMEDASGVDLDWFWKGWFYGNDHVDMEIEGVNVYRLDDGNPKTSKQLDKQDEELIPDTPYEQFLAEIETVADKHDHLQDWYYSYDKYEATEKEMQTYEKALNKLEDWQKDLLDFADMAYVISVRNKGGMVMPLVFDIEFKRGQPRRLEIPVEVWRYDDELVKVPFLSDREVVRVTLDKDNAFADADLDNNKFPQEFEEGRFKLKQRKKQANPMRTGLYPDADKENGEESEN